MTYRIVITGFGTVAQGFSELLLQKAHELKNNYNIDYKIVGIVDLSYGLIYNKEGFDLKEILEIISTGKKFYEKFDEYKKVNAKEILRYEDYDVLIETTPTNLKTGIPAFTFISEALQRGKNVITTNKGPIALRYKELQELADRNNCSLKFEGTVLSGTPVFNFLQHSLAGSAISKIEGILNGTSNYILSEMAKGKEYGSALKKAQELGYAESKPSADVDGWDAVAKAMILSAVVFNNPLKVEDVDRIGITQIDQAAIKEAEKENKVWKLIVKIENENDKVNASVKPVKLDLNHQLANIDGALNALNFTTDTLGEVTIMGAGAGKVETGYSILNDLILINEDLKR
jgi:homoserine dehydrogenase